MKIILSALIAISTVISSPTVLIEKSMVQNGSDGLLRADVRIEEVQDGLVGAAFHLRYDPEMLEYQSYEEGDFFEQLGKPLYLVTNKPGRLIFGASLTRGYGLAEGQGRLVSFYFKQIQAGEAVLSFSNTNLASFEGKRVDKQGKWLNLELQTSVLESGSLEGIIELIIGIILFLSVGIGLYIRRKGIVVNSS